MNYTGIIIEESLRDPRLLDTITITDTRVEAVTPSHQTPWLKQWTLHAVAIPADQAEAVAEQLSEQIDTSHNAWYIDFKNDSTHYIIFPNKVFKVDRSQAYQYQAATEYGVQLGIPDYQLDFSPHIAEWQRQSDTQD